MSLTQSPGREADLRPFYKHLETKGITVAYLRNYSKTYYWNAS